MTMFGAVSAAFTGLRAHSDAVQTISDNIVNMGTPGYKTGDMRFKEIISEVARDKSRTEQTHMGTAPVFQMFIDLQGSIEFTNRSLDVAIQGEGFLVSNTSVDGSGATELTRNGQISTLNVNTGTADELYLTDVKGNFLQGWPTDDTGAFVTGSSVSSLQSMRVDSGAFSISAKATSTALTQVNLDAESATGDTFTADIRAFDEGGTEHNVRFTYTKTATLNQWNMVATVDNGTISTAQPITLVFDDAGALTSPTSQTLDFTYTNTGGGTASIAFDLSTMSQFSGGNIILDLQSDGAANGLLDSIAFGANGEVIGNFSNGASRNIFKVPLATVQEPNELALRFNTHYAATDRSGDIELLEADLTGRGTFVPSSLEMSTTDLGQEMAKLIAAQQSFSSNGQSLRLINEMTRTAIDLKRQNLSSLDRGLRAAEIPRD